jgi:hypothetical protein
MSSQVEDLPEVNGCVFKPRLIGVNIRHRKDVGGGLVFYFIFEGQRVHGRASQRFKWIVLHT